MKLLNILTSLLLFFIFFIWAFNGDYSNIFSFYFPYLPLIFFLIFLIFSIRKVKISIVPTLDFFTEHSFKIFPALAFAYALFFSIFILSALPHVQDEINMFFQAEAILNGGLSRPLHPFYEFFRFLYIIPSKGGTYSLYQPGYSILLAPFIFLGVPYLLNPLLTGGAVFLLGKNVEKMFDRKTAALSMFLATVSAFLIPMGGTFMNHTFCAFSSLASMWFIQKSFEKKPFLNTGIACLFIVLIMFTRPQTALFILISTIVFIFLKQDKKRFLYQAVTAGAVILPFFLLIFFTDSIFSGKLFLPKHIAYFSYSEPVNGSLGLGLYKGCRFNTIIPLPKEGLTISHAYYITYLRLVQMIYGMFFHPIFFIYLPALFLMKRKAQETLPDYIFLQYFLVTFVAFFFYYYDGNVYGPRYYYEVSFFLIPLFARGIILSTRKLSEINSLKFLQPRLIVYSFILSGFIFHYTVTAPQLFRLHRNAFWGTDPALSKLVDKKGIKNSLIFISPYRFYSSGAAIMDLSDIDSNNNIYAVNLGDSYNAVLADYYKNRKIYKVVFREEWYEDMPFEFQEVKELPVPEKMTVEMEHKSYPVEGIPDYCNKFPAWPNIDSYSGFELPQDMTDNTYFFCRFISEDQFYTFGQYVNKAGKYKITIKAVFGPVGTRFKLTSRNQEKILNFYLDEYDYKDLEIKLDFEKGLNFIKLQPLDIRKNGGYFIIDKLEFEPEEK